MIVFFWLNVRIIFQNIRLGGQKSRLFLFFESLLGGWSFLSLLLTINNNLLDWFRFSQAVCHPLTQTCLSLSIIHRGFLIGIVLCWKLIVRCYSFCLDHALKSVGLHTSHKDWGYFGFKTHLRKNNCRTFPRSFKFNEVLFLLFSSPLVIISLFAHLDFHFLLGELINCSELEKRSRGRLEMKEVQ